MTLSPTTKNWLTEIADSSPNNKLWAAACAKELINLGEELYAKGKDEGVKKSVDWLRQFIHEL
jgi:hypothetical protein